MLELIDVTKTYVSPTAGEDVTVLKDVNLKVEQGDSLAVVGPSGSGKSTLLNIIGALDKPTSGKVIFEDKHLNQLDNEALADIRNLRIGFIFQLHHLLPQCTVLENVLVPTLARSDGVKSQKDLRSRAIELLKKVGLEESMLHKPGELSGGQRQRVAVARALINSPALLLADEPTGSLDKKTSENITDLLVEINKTENVTLIVVTHSERLAEKMRKLYKINEGRLMSENN